MERTKPEFNKSRWLEAIWEPEASIYALPGGLDMIDITGEGDARLIIADLGNSIKDTPKIRVFKGSDQVTECNMTDVPCGVVGFYSENGNSRSAFVAVGAGSSVYIYKNMKPYFKYCLPPLEAHPEEVEIWRRAGLEEKINVSDLIVELENLVKKLGAGLISSRSLEFLTMNENSRSNFAEQYRTVSVVKANVVCAIGSVRKNSWNNFYSSYLLVGTESGEILILDSRGFLVVEKIVIGWPPVAMTHTGLWIGDGHIIVIGRNGQLGSVEKGRIFKQWDKLSSPIVAVAPLTCEGAAVVLMNGTYYGFSKTGSELWKMNLQGKPLDMISLPIRQSVVSLLAISIANFGIRIYDEKHHVDTIKIMDSISVMKYGRLGHEEQALSMITTGGGLCVKILKRTANFNVRPLTTESVKNNEGTLKIPKKTRLFVEQTIRERAEAAKIHKIFQQGLIRLRFTVTKRAYEAMIEKRESIYNPISLEPSVLGLGPRYKIQTVVTNVSDKISDNRLFFVYWTDNVNCNPRFTDIPLLVPGFSVPFTVNATLINENLPGKLKIILCKEGVQKPYQIVNIVLPIPEYNVQI